MITRLSGRGLLPFREPFDVPLAGQGLVLIRGDNKVSASSNDNGSGKTSILHILSWVIFGKDLKGRRADAMANRFTDEPGVGRVDMEDALGLWSIIRSCRPSGLEVEGLGVPEDSNMDVVQGAIEARLGFGYSTFCNAVVFGQGSFERFAHADQAEQLRMLDEIQGIDYSEPLKRAKDWRTKLSDTREEIAGSISSDTVTLASARKQLQTLTGIRDTFEDAKAGRIARAQTSRNAAGALLKSANAAVKEIDTHAKLLVRLRKADNLRVDLEGKLSKAKQNESTAGWRQDETSRKLHQHEEGLADLIASGTCPKCRGSVQDAKKIAARFTKDLTTLQAEHAEAAEEYRKTLGVTAAALEALEVQQTKVRELVPGSFEPSRYLMQLEVECSPRAIKEAAAKVGAAEREVAEADAEISRIEGEKWDGMEGLEAAERDVTLLTARIARETGRLERAALALRVAEYCVEAFSDRGIRSLMVDSVADFMNERMEYHLGALAAGEAKTVMSATTALKKGGTKEKISFSTEWTYGGVGPDDGSGGQDRRKDLAVFASVQDLAESRSARPFPLKAYDEPFDALDSRGKEMACAWVRGQAREYGTVLLITHSEELAGLANPDQVWTIEHSENGARVSLP